MNFVTSSESAKSYINLEGPVNRKTEKKLFSFSKERPDQTKNAVSIFHKYHSFLSEKCKTQAKQYLNNVTFSRTASIHNLEQCKLKRRIFSN